MTDSLPPLPPPDAEPVEPRASRRSSRQLFKVGAFGVAALLAYYAFTAQVDDPLLLYEGLAILFLAVLPSLLWARRGGDQLPVFEVLLLTTANAYALPVLNGHADLKVYPTDLISLCAGAVLLFQITAISTYLLIRGRPGPGAARGRAGDVHRRLQRVRRLRISPVRTARTPPRLLPQLLQRPPGPLGTTGER